MFGQGADPFPALQSPGKKEGGRKKNKEPGANKTKLLSSFH
jgi:hypothetical protein